MKKKIKKKKKTKERIKETKLWFLGKVNKIDKRLARLIRESERQ